MKKIRFIPYGYTMRNGRMIIDHEEAEIVRYIFDSYINGASLRELAEELSLREIPYSEKTCSWDKARVSRIIENSRYTGEDEFDPIIDQEIYDDAVSAKAARQTNTTVKECEGIALIRNRVRCARCGAPMVRRVCTKRKVRESWKCTSDDCGFRVRISDGDLLRKITLTMNRIIENTELMLPKQKARQKDSPFVEDLQSQLDAELMSEAPDEGLVVDFLKEIAGHMYRESKAKDQIAARVAMRRAALMHPQETFNCTYFSDLVETVILSDLGPITLITKTKTEVSEEDETDGGHETT